MNAMTRGTHKKDSKLHKKLIWILFSVMFVSVMIFAFLTWIQIVSHGNQLRDMSISETIIVNDSVEENLERVTTDMLQTFMQQRDQDVLLLAQMMPSDESFKAFSETRNSPLEFIDGSGEMRPLFDEITFIDLYGQELFKYVSSNSTKVNFPMNPELMDVSDVQNTYTGVETYWEVLRNLQPGEIYVSDVIGMLEPGQNFEGIVRWATPVVDFNGEIWGYVTMALNYDHILAFNFNSNVENIAESMTLMEERLGEAIDANTREHMFILIAICVGMLLLMLLVARLTASYITKSTRSQDKEMLSKFSEEIHGR